MSGESKADGGRVKAMMDSVRGRYGDRMSAGELDEALESVRGIVKASDAMRAVPPDNGDIPFVATPHRGD